MFCNQCGSPCEDGAKFCKSCGNPLQAAAPQAAPQQPVYQQPVYQQPVYQQPAPQQPAQATDFVGMLKKNWTMIIAVVAAFALVLGILTTFCILEVPVSAGGQSAYNSISEIADTMKMFDKSSVTLYIGNILFGLVSLAVGAVGILYFLKKKNNMPYYDQFIAKYVKGENPAFVMGALGALGVVVQFVMFLLSGFKIWGVKFSVSLPWLSWVALVLFAGLAAVDKFVLNKKQ